MRWSGADQAAIVAPPVWLARVATNLCLNRLASVRVHREVYIGPWLPEPVLTLDGMLGPMDSAAQRDSVSLALLVLLERLTPGGRTRSPGTSPARLPPVAYREQAHRG